MFSKYFFVFLLTLCSMIGCHNGQTKSIDKDKKESQKDVYNLYYHQGDACRYKDWFFGIPYATTARELKCPIFFEDTLSNGDILYGQSYRNFFFIKSKKTKKFYPIFEAPIFGASKEDIASEMRYFSEESKDTRLRIQNIFYVRNRQMRFYQHGLLKLLELQTINDTLPKSAIEFFFDEIFASLNFYKDKKNRLEHGHNYVVAKFFTRFPLKKDANLVSLKKFLKTPNAKNLPNYELIRIFVSPSTFSSFKDILCYEIYKNAYLIIYKSNKVDRVHIEMYGDYMPYVDPEAKEMH